MFRLQRDSFEICSQRLVPLDSPELHNELSVGFRERLSRFDRIRMLCDKKMDVWCGWEDLAYESLVMGCTGWVCPTSNVIPRMTVKLFELVQAGKYQDAEKLYYKMLPLLIYLEAGVETLVRQIGARGRAFELGISREYLQRLNTLYAEWIERYDKGTVLKIPSDRVDFVNNPADLDAIVRDLLELLTPAGSS